jgi:hypothetical protein
VSKGKRRAFQLPAFHESGHAICHHYFGHKLNEIAIGENSGHCEVEVPAFDGGNESSPAERETVMQVITASLAGGIAVQRFSGDGANGKGDGGDRAHVKYLALRLSEGRENEAEALLDWLRHKAQSAVDQHWRAIETLAYALLQKEKLSGEEVQKILAGKNGER